MPALKMEKMGFMTRAQKPSPENGGKSLTKPDPLVQYVFTLSASTIKKLKSEACEGFTSFEVTCVHFWKRTSSTKKSPPGGWGFAAENALGLEDRRFSRGAKTLLHLYSAAHLC
ncbi:hypothetical protein GOP47_0005397 [Adiantum capillus-veneris]|uniref:Uncharacterized protein n=1 Tax=Adiantum capillus-veneris TaxID=13818 RepID=A0A9D4V599_ADICA|nr:hypothetical protein GOP47_0005397 [Adiantum capillus-veneris]